MANTPPRRYPVTRKYLMSRGSCFKLDYTRFVKFLKSENDIYGVVIDLPVAPNVWGTLCAYANGAANIYYNNGVEYSGASKRYIEVVKAAQMVVYQAGLIKDKAKKIDNYDMPMQTLYNCTLLTKEGMFNLKYVPVFKEEEIELRHFQYTIQNLMKELHDAQTKDANSKK